MITPIDIICLQMSYADQKVEHVHYHLADPPRSHPQGIMEEANFHLVDRHITMDQIGFDYYENTVTYRV